MSYFCLILLNVFNNKICLILLNVCNKKNLFYSVANYREVLTHFAVVSYGIE